MSQESVEAKNSVKTGWFEHFKHLEGQVDHVLLEQARGIVIMHPQIGQFELLERLSSLLVAELAKVVQMPAHKVIEHEIEAATLPMEVHIVIGGEDIVVED